MVSRCGTSFHFGDSRDIGNAWSAAFARIGRGNVPGASGAPATNGSANRKAGYKDLSLHGITMFLRPYNAGGQFLSFYYKKTISDSDKVVGNRT